MFYAVIAFSVLILTAPLSFKLRVFISLENKKAYYSLFFMNKLRLNSGYLHVNKKYLVVNYSDKKAIAVHLKTFLPGSGIEADFIRLEPLAICYSLILGDSGEKNIAVAAVANCFNSVIYSLLKAYKPYAVFRGDVILTDFERSAIFAELTLGFCVLILLETAVVKLIGSIVDYAKRKFG